MLYVYNSTRALQPVATCRQSPYLHKPAIIIVTSFSLWRHSLLSWPHPALRTYVLGYLVPYNGKKVIKMWKYNQGYLATINANGRLRGNVRTSSIARWKAREWLSIRHKWTFFASSYRWGATSTSSSAVAEGPRDALSQLKSCQLLHNCTKSHIWLEGLPFHVV